MSIAEPTLRRWTVEEYHRAADAGVFAPGERLELIDGEIYWISPQKGPHLVATGLTRVVMERLFSTGWIVLVQAPVALGGDSEPEPDLAIVRGEWRDFVTGPPSTAELVIEVSDSTLAFDQGPKARRYARAGIAEYWIVNLPERLLEIRRDPDPVRAEYQTLSRHGSEEIVSPLATPSASVAVRDLLP
jgi:Uma2 family endonuclease